MRLEFPEQTHPAHALILPMRWGDMDALGHVNNTVYFRYMESARIAWLESLGKLPGVAAQGFVIANAFCNFVQQLRYPGDVVVKTFLGDMGRSTVDTWVTIERVDKPNVVCANGGATLVWVDYKAQRSAPLPAALRERLAPRAA